MTHTEPTAAISLTMPKAWIGHLAGYRWVEQTIGRSEAAVFRLEASGRPTLFVKREETTPFGELPHEIKRLRWLAASAIPCPKALAEERIGKQQWLLMSALSGRDLASSPDLSPKRIVEITADALRVLHSVDIRSCPFDHRLDQRIAQARARMEAGLVDEEDFDEERLGRSAAEIYKELLARRPNGEDLVVTHGDASLPNLLADDDGFTGFVDCARVGVSDRHQDLALASWTIQYNLGEEWIEPFLHRYGGQIDPERIAWYRLLDEFF